VRIQRIRLKSFGGVVDSEARFAPQGATIVEGPNEVGKSTLLRALDLLFNYRDDSKSEDVRAAKPVDRDVGPEVEADLEIGGCDFTYFKRFHRDRETRLNIRSPKPEHLAGRDAHDRVQQLLEQNLDTAMWKALRIVQGERVDLPDLKGQSSIAQALDQAAGQALADEREEALFEAVRAGYLNYWTDKGKEREDPLGKARASAADYDAKNQALRHKLAALESDIARHSRLEWEIADARPGLVRVAACVGHLEKAWDEISKLKKDGERLRTEHQAAAKETRLAQNAANERQRLVVSAREAAKRVSEFTSKEIDAQPALEQATRELEEAREVRKNARDAADRAEKDRALRRKDREFRHDELDLALISERLARIQATENATGEANKILARSRITEPLRIKIRNADVEVKKARAGVEASSSQLHVRALRDIEVTLDNEPTKLARDERRSLLVNEAVTL
jgi:chromosome segregation ATPase